MKQLKIWNGRGHGKFSGGSIYVAAHSKKQAAELISQACDTHIGISEITNYYANCWGNPMAGIIPTQPCVYATTNFYDKNPIQII